MRTLTWIEATAGDPALDDLWSFLADRVEHLAAGRIATRLQHTAVDTGGIRTEANRLMNDAAVLAACLDARARSDALVIGCWGAPTAAVRSAVDIPALAMEHVLQLRALADANVEPTPRGYVRPTAARETALVATSRRLSTAPPTPDGGRLSHERTTS